MVLLLTASLILLALGAVLLMISMRRRPVKPTATADSPPPRRVRPVPMVLGLILLLAGGAGAVWLLAIEGMGSPRPDEWVLSQWPGNRLVAQLNSEDHERRRDAGAELQRRVHSGNLSDSTYRLLVRRSIARHIGDADDPARPIHGGALVRVDLLQANERGVIDRDTWGRLLARTAPKSIRVTDRVNPGDPIVMRTSMGLLDDNALAAEHVPDAPAWLVMIVDEIQIDGEPVEPPQAMVVARNPAWEAPARPEGPVLGGGPGSPLTRQVRFEDVLLPAGFPTEGIRQFTARMRVYSIDPEVAAPIESAEPTERGVPALTSGRIDIAQAEELAQRAMGMWKWPITARIRVGDGDAPAAPPAATEPGREVDSAG